MDYIKVNGKYEHREVYFKAHRKTPRNWQVHHINHKKNDNILSNLIAMPQVLHFYIHREAKSRGKKFSREEIERELIKYTALKDKIKTAQRELDKYSKIKKNIKVKNKSNNKLNKNKARQQMKKASLRSNNWSEVFSLD